MLKSDQALCDLRALFPNNINIGFRCSMSVSKRDTTVDIVVRGQKRATLRTDVHGGLVTIAYAEQTVLGQKCISRKLSVNSELKTRYVRAYYSTMALAALDLVAIYGL